MYDKNKADITSATVDIHVALDKIAAALKSQEVVLSNATRVAVLDEQLQLAKRCLGAALSDCAKTTANSQPDNFSPEDIVKLDNDIVHLETLVDTAKFHIRHVR